MGYAFSYFGANAFTLSNNELLCPIVIYLRETSCINPAAVGLFHVLATVLVSVSILFALGSFIDLK
ncbi:MULTISPECIES: hypothetical protein [Arcobacteraceae]|uniref:hypothetical protein n=1 Tax=Arcobacteraceae TaxID=2808963 RepID=UPI0012ECE821|nr:MULTISPECIES: hypothetical protein [Arcobacteraceae]